MSKYNQILYNITHAMKFLAKLKDIKEVWV